eukprot:RCo034462
MATAAPPSREAKEKGYASPPRVVPSAAAAGAPNSGPPSARRLSGSLTTTLRPPDIRAYAPPGPSCRSLPKTGAAPPKQSAPHPSVLAQRCPNTCTAPTTAAAAAPVAPSCRVAPVVDCSAQTSLLHGVDPNFSETHLKPARGNATAGQSEALPAQTGPCPGGNAVIVGAPTVEQISAQLAQAEALVRGAGAQIEA